MLAAIAVMAAMVGSAGYPPPTSLVGRLRAWESRFESVWITYLTNRSPAVWTLCTLPTRETLTASSRVVASYEGGVFYRVIPKGSGDLVGMSYGSYASRTVTALLSDSRSVLFTLGVLLSGDTKLSDALAQARSATLDLRGGSFAEFEWALGPDDTGTVRIDWARHDDVPARFSLKTRSWSLVRAFHPSGEHIWPLRVHETMQAHGKASVAGRWFTVKEPRPATSETQSLIPKPGDKVMDEDFNISYVEGEPVDLDPSLATKTLAFARAGEPFLQKPSRQFLCGVDCLYYLTRLRNLDVTTSRLNNLIPEAKRRGCNFSELRSAAAALGIRLRGLHLSLDALRRSGKMAILSLRNSHFALVVPRGSNPMALIDPPYSVRILRDLDYDVLWTGDALVDES